MHMSGALFAHVRCIHPRPRIEQAEAPEQIEWPGQR